MNNKPLLVMPKQYFDIFKRMHSPIKLQVYSFFGQVLSCEDVTGENVMAILVTDTEIRPETIKLDYYFSHNQVSGNACSFDNFSTTAPVPKNGQLMTSNELRQPRFVIWPEGTVSGVNATCVYRCKSLESFPYALQQSIQWATLYNNGPPCLIKNLSIVVFDLDRTLVYSDEFPKCGPLPNYELILKMARQHFDLVMLWSHGGTIHVHEQLKAIDFEFDLVLCLDENTESTCKSLLHIYNHLPANIRFKFAMLFDDSAYNWTPEYNCMIIPDRKLHDLKNLSIAIDKVCY